MPGAERRRAQRFPLDLPLEVKYGANGEAVRKPAELQDISASGIYFMVDQSLEPDSKVEFYVRLQMENAPGGSVWLHCIGSVVRVEASPEDPAHVGVAARIDRYRFVRGDQVPSEFTAEGAESED